MASKLGHCFGDILVELEVKPFSGYVYTMTIMIVMILASNFWFAKPDLQ